MESAASGSTWQARLRARGHRLTPQRELVLEAVERLGHGTPEEVHAEVAERSSAVNISTVYRTLTLLDELGLIRRVELGDRTSVYHSRAGAAHVHLTCTTCGSVTDADPADFEAMAAALRAEHGFTVDLETLVVQGSCARCGADRATRS